jgi:hypothetical protein
MPHRVKLDFEPLSLEETAKKLRIPKARAAKILALVGVGAEALNCTGRIRHSAKKRAHAGTAFSRAAKGAETKGTD